MTRYDQHDIDPYKGLSFIEDDNEFDLVVIGAGAGGFAAAIFAALQGHKPILIERTPYVGGTTALSGGTTWVPLTRYLADTATDDSFDKVMGYLDHVVGDFSKRELRESFVKNGAKAIHTLVDNTEVRFRVCAKHPDYVDQPGTTLCGRALEPIPYVADRLSKARNLLRPPIEEFTVLGGMMINREDINHLLRRFKSPTSFLYTVKLVSQFFLDKIRFGKPRRSVMGHALISRLLQSAIDLDIPILVNTEVTNIEKNSDGKVSRVTLQQAGITKTVVGREGVIIASGGFGRNPEKRNAMLPKQLHKYSPSADGHSSNLHSLAEDLGAHYGTGHDQSSFWAPVSTRIRKDGSTAVFPHFLFDRSKPGTLCVNLNGDRFINETVSYHDFSKVMLEGGKETDSAWLIAGSSAIAKYGLGMIRPASKKFTPYLEDGYLIKGRDISELADKLGISEANLHASIESINHSADSGTDPLFGRGSTEYQRNNGDPEHTPNPTIGKLDAPYYAVRIKPADIGTSLGLEGNENGQLLDKEGNPIPGLYACGNDLHSIMGGVYPGPGITIGPAIVFGYLAATDALNHANKNTTTKNP